MTKARRVKINTYARKYNRRVKLPCIYGWWDINNARYVYIGITMRFNKRISAHKTNKDRLCRFSRELALNPLNYRCDKLYEKKITKKRLYYLESLYIKEYKTYAPLGFNDRKKPPATDLFELMGIKKPAKLRGLGR